MKWEEDKKLKILKNARDHFLEHGYSGASIRNIARDAGLTTGALYHYFGARMNSL